MNVKVLFGFFLISLLDYVTSNFMDCLQANQTCHNDQKCSLLLSVIPRQCGDGAARIGESCSPLQIQYCSQSLREVLAHNYFQTCECPHNMPNFEECETFRESVFHHKCAQIVQDGGRFSVQTRAGGYGALYAGADQLGRSAGGGTDCLEMRKSCQADRLCSRDLTSFRQHCKVRNRRCYAESRERCIEAYEALRPSGMFHCSCASQRRQHGGKKCNGILRRFAKNACLVVANQAAIEGREGPELPDKPKLSPDAVPGADDKDPLDVDTPAIPDNAAPGTEDEDEGSDEDYDNWVDDPGPPLERIVPPTAVPMTDVSCYRAFASCNADSVCRVRVGKFLTACQWDLAKNTCNRQQCLPAMNSFFQTVDMKHAHAAAFCVCEPDDRQCHSLKAVLQPKCAQLETPVPSCLSVYRKCMADDTCRKRYEYYDTYCSEGRRGADCQNTKSMCRDAVVGLMGTILMTNCSCEYEVAINRCRSVKRNLHENRCRVISEHPLSMTPSTIPETAARAGTTNLAPRPRPTQSQTNILEDEKQVVKIHVNNMANVKKHKTCIRRRPDIRHKTFRMYPNQTECSQLCHCLLNGTLSCRDLPCPKVEPCKIDGITYTQGTLFLMPGRGQCQCRGGETICSKPGAQPLDDGVYLFVGYSIGDMYTLANYSVKIRYTALSQKLTHLLNGDRYIDTCTVSKYAHSQGNIVFRIDTLRTSQQSRYYTSHSWNSNSGEVQQDPEEGCYFKAKLLEIIINGRQEAIYSDPELSVIRMATVETIENKASSRRSGATNNSHGGLITTLLVTLLVLARSVLWRWAS